MSEICKTTFSSTCNNCLCLECALSKTCSYHKKQLRQAKASIKHCCVVKKCKNTQYNPDMSNFIYDIIHNEEKKKEFENEVYNHIFIPKT